MLRTIIFAFSMFCLIGLSFDAEAQQPSGKSFGARVCAENLSCDVRYNSTNLESLIAIANDCVVNGLNITNMPADYFNKNAGIDSSNCLATNIGSNPEPMMYAKCCIFESADDNNACKLICNKISVR